MASFTLGGWNAVTGDNRRYPQPVDFRRGVRHGPRLTLLVLGLSQVPVVELLPWYVAAYLLPSGPGAFPAAPPG